VVVLVLHVNPDAIKTDKASHLDQFGRDEWRIAKKQNILSCPHSLDNPILPHLHQRNFLSQHE